MKRIEKVHTTNEAAEMLGVTPGRIRQMIIAGEIEARKHGRDLMITSSQIEKARSRKTKPGPMARAESDLSPSGRSKRKARKKNSISNEISLDK